MLRNAIPLTLSSFLGMLAGPTDCASAGALNIHTDILIRAKPAVVWSVLADNKRYAEWNPYHVKVEGHLAPGQKIALEIHKPDGRQVFIRPHVMRVVENEELTWGGGIPGLFQGIHVFELHALGPHCTRLVQRETFSGLFVRFAHLEGIEEGYRQVNKALKARSEAFSPAPTSACR